jgi:hypothetical protein
VISGRTDGARSGGRYTPNPQALKRNCELTEPSRDSNSRPSRFPRRASSITFTPLAPIMCENPCFTKVFAISNLRNSCRYSAARSARATAGRLFAAGAVTSALYALRSSPGRAVAYAAALVMALWAAVFSRPSVAVMETTLAIEEVALVDEEDVVMQEQDPRGGSRDEKTEEDTTQMVEAGELAAEWTPEVTPEVSRGNSEKEKEEEEEDVFASGGEEDADAAATDEVAAEAAGRASEIARLRGKVVKLRAEADRLRRSRGHLAARTRGLRDENEALTAARDEVASQAESPSLARSSGLTVRGRHFARYFARSFASMCPVCRETMLCPGSVFPCCNNVVCGSCVDATAKFMLFNGCPLCRSTMGRFSIIVDFTETFEMGLLPSICVKRNGEVKTLVVSERTLRAILRSISKAHDNVLLPCRTGKLRMPTTTAAHLCPQLYLQRKHIQDVDLMRTEAMSEITDCVINFLKTVSELAPSGSFMKAFLGGTRKSIYFTGGITKILHPTFSVVVREHLCLPDENKLDHIEVRDEVMDVWELW